MQHSGQPGCAPQSPMGGCDIGVKAEVTKRRPVRKKAARSMKGQRDNTAAGGGNDLQGSRNSDRNEGIGSAKKRKGKIAAG